MTVAAIERCLCLVEALAGEPEPLELSRLAREVKLPVSATHRTLTTLAARGWVVQDAGSQRYALSLRLATLAFRDLDARVVPDIVQRVLDELAEGTREYCRLAVVEDENLVWVARAQGARAALRYDPDMGREIALHATANGKAWLATLPESEALRLVAGRGLEPAGPRAVRSVASLRRALRTTRQAGYATAVEEGEAGIAALAVAFRADGGGPAVGTVSVAGPLLRITPDRYAELHAALERAAVELGTLWSLRARQRPAAAARR